jgi:DNA-binding transcriptional LysR family regulator
MVSCCLSKTMADNFFDMLVFVRVVEAGSLSGGERGMRLSLAVVSRKLARLEERLGVRLVNRTTQTLALTEEGASFHVRCFRILADVEEAEMAVTSARQTASGVLRATSTVAFGRRRLAPLLREFQLLHPDLQVHLDATDAVVNIIEGGYVLAIRFGTQADTSLIARKLAPNVRVICGAPDYLDRRGRPQAIEDLLTHDCVVYGDPPLDHWSFAGGPTIRIRSLLSCNDGELAHAWALQGAGLVLKSIWDVHDDIDGGRFEIVLPGQPLPASLIRAVCPHSRYAAAKVRLCVEFLLERLGSETGTFQIMNGVQVGGSNHGLPRESRSLG